MRLVDIVFMTTAVFTETWGTPTRLTPESRSCTLSCSCRNLRSKINWLMSFGEIIGVCSENHTKAINRFEL
jgi:hypothetical protein